MDKRRVTRPTTDKIKYHCWVDISKAKSLAGWLKGEGGRVGVRIGVAGGAGGTGYGWRRNCLCASGYG